MSTRHATTARAALDATTLEKDFQRAVLDYAKLRGWTFYHTWSAKHSVSGFPDLVLVRNGRLIFAELKRERGKVSREQQHWLVELATTPAEVHLWRPADWNAIEHALW